MMEFCAIFKRTAICCGLLITWFSLACPVVIRGIGATFPAEVYAISGRGFEADRSEFVDVDFDYKLQNSIAGKEAMLDADPEVTFGATESALTSLESSQNPDLTSIPVIAG